MAGFNRFLKFCAISVGQELNVNELSKKSGFSVQTVNSWLSVLQESYVIYLLQPYYNNIGKRLLKSPKLYFYDTGLLASLIGIKETEDFEKSDKKGFIFENFVISDIMKNYFNKNEEPELYYWRDSNQVEVDLIDDSGIDLKLVEIKSAKTANSNFAKSLNSVGNLLEVPDSNRFVIFQGENRVRVNNVTFDKWENITKF